MKQENKETTLKKPIFLLALQLIALSHIFNLLSTTEQFTESNTYELAFSLVFIMISSLVTFKLLDTLKAQEAYKKNITS